MQLMPLYIALDKNKDNKLSESEIANAVAALRTLDKNRNGVIDTEELAPDAEQMRAQRGQRSPDAGQGDMRRGPGGQGGGKAGKAGGRGRRDESSSQIPAGTKPRRPGSDG